MARNIQSKADIEALKKLEQSQLIDTRPIIAYTMRKSGCTFNEIAAVFGVSRQRAETIVKSAERNL